MSSLRGTFALRARLPGQAVPDAVDALPMQPQPGHVQGRLRSDVERFAYALPDRT